MSRLFPEVADAPRAVSSILFPEISGRGPGAEEIAAAGAVPEVQDTPSKAAYRAGLEALLGGHEEAALAAWKLSQEPEAVRGVERITQKRNPTPPAGSESQEAYRKGLEAFLGDDLKQAETFWTEASKDPNNLDAKRGWERLAMKRGEAVP